MKIEPTKTIVSIISMRNIISPFRKVIWFIVEK